MLWNISANDRAQIFIEELTADYADDTDGIKEEGVFRSCEFANAWN
jgi:hypothetical protein